MPKSKKEETGQILVTWVQIKCLAAVHAFENTWPKLREKYPLQNTHRMPNTDFGFIYENKTDYVTIRESTMKHQPSLKPSYIHTYIYK